MTDVEVDPSSSLHYNICKYDVLILFGLIKSILLKEMSELCSTTLIKENVKGAADALKCRVCLRGNMNKMCYLFESWNPPWQGMEATIAEDFTKITQVHVCIYSAHKILSFARLQYEYLPVLDKIV